MWVSDDDWPTALGRPIIRDTDFVRPKSVAANTMREYRSDDLSDCQVNWLAPISVVVFHVCSSRARRLSNDLCGSALSQITTHHWLNEYDSRRRTIPHDFGLIATTDQKVSDRFPAEIKKPRTDETF